MVMTPVARATSWMPSSNTRSCAPDRHRPDQHIRRVRILEHEAKRIRVADAGPQQRRKSLPLTLNLAISLPPTLIRSSSLVMIDEVTDSMRGVGRPEQQVGAVGERNEQEDDQADGRIDEIDAPEQPAVLVDTSQCGPFSKVTGRAIRGAVSRSPIAHKSNGADPEQIWRHESAQAEQRADVPVRQRDHGRGRNRKPRNNAVASGSMRHPAAMPNGSSDDDQIPEHVLRQQCELARRSHLPWPGRHDEAAGGTARNRNACGSLRRRSHAAGAAASCKIPHPSACRRDRP